MVFVYNGAYETVLKLLQGSLKFTHHYVSMFYKLSSDLCLIIFLCGQNICQEKSCLFYLSFDLRVSCLNFSNQLAYPDLHVTYYSYCGLVLCSLCYYVWSLMHVGHTGSRHSLFLQKLVISWFEWYAQGC